MLFECFVSMKDKARVHVGNAYLRSRRSLPFVLGLIRSLRILEDVN